MNPTVIYYRLLHSKEHFDNWQTKHFNSYHYLVPGEWSDVYYKKHLRAPSDFPLMLNSGLHTEGARNAFLELAGQYEPGVNWDEKHLRRVSQLDGVCAFGGRACLDKYASGERYGGMMVVEFEGEFVSKIPESSGGTGALVKPIRVITLTYYTASFH